MPTEPKCAACPHRDNPAQPCECVEPHWAEGYPKPPPTRAEIDERRAGKVRLKLGDELPGRR